MFTISCCGKHLVGKVFIMFSLFCIYFAYYSATNNSNATEENGDADIIIELEQEQDIENAELQLDLEESDLETESYNEAEQLENQEEIIDTDYNEEDYNAENVSDNLSDEETIIEEEIEEEFEPEPEQERIVEEELQTDLEQELELKDILETEELSEPDTEVDEQPTEIETSTDTEPDTEAIADKEISNEEAEFEQEAEQDEMSNQPTKGAAEVEKKSLYSCAQGGTATLLPLLIVMLFAFVFRRRKKAINTALLLFAITVWTQQAHAEKITNPANTRIAVVPIVAKYGVPQGVADLITGQIVGELSKKKFIITPMQDVKKIIETEAMRQKLSSCEEASCFVELGNALGVDYLLLGEIGKLGDTYLFSLRLVSVRSAKTSAWSEYLESGSEKAFVKLLPAALYTLFPRIFPPPVDQFDEIEAAKQGKVVDTKTETNSVKATPKLTKELSHDGLFLISMYSHTNYNFDGIAGTLSLGYGLTKYFELNVASVFAPKSVGLRFESKLFVYNQQGHFKPFVASTITTFFTDTIPVGIGVMPGVFYDPTSWIGVFAALPLEYYFSTPKDIEPWHFSYVLGVQVRI